MSDLVSFSFTDLPKINTILESFLLHVISLNQTFITIFLSGTITYSLKLVDVVVIVAGTYW